MDEAFLLRPDAYTIWSDPDVSRLLSWYRAVMLDEKPTKFLIAKRIPADENPRSLGEKELWEIHGKLTSGFKRTWLKIRNESLDLEELPMPEHSLLDVKIELAKRLMDPCRLCEWNCGARRLGGEWGICMVGDRAIVHSYFLHMGEEAPLVPSGTIFYGGCNFRCVFCQNYDISQINARGGPQVTPRQLAAIQRKLRLHGARNINHVGGEPTPNIPFIVESLKHLDVNVPQLWNSNMYMTREALLILKDLIDIWLPDFKYGNNNCAWKYSKIRKYWETVTRNMKMIYGEGDIIIRHLVLPGHIECCTRKILEWIAENTPNVLVNIMDQYRPEHLVAKHPERFREIARRPSRIEIIEAYRIAEDLGLIYRPIS